MNHEIRSFLSKVLILWIFQVEKEVVQLVQAWEEEQERPFLLNGVRFVEFIANQKLDCERKKEEEKMQRVSFENFLIYQFSFHL